MTCQAARSCPKIAFGSRYLIWSSQNLQMSFVHVNDVTSTLHTVKTTVPTVPLGLACRAPKFRSQLFADAKNPGSFLKITSVPPVYSSSWRSQRTHPHRLRSQLSLAASVSMPSTQDLATPFHHCTIVSIPPTVAPFTFVGAADRSRISTNEQ